MRLWLLALLSVPYTILNVLNHLKIIYAPYWISVPYVAILFYLSFALNSAQDKLLSKERIISRLKGIIGGNARDSKQNWLKINERLSSVKDAFRKYSLNDDEPMTVNNEMSELKDKLEEKEIVIQHLLSKSSNNNVSKFIIQNKKITHRQNKRIAKMKERLDTMKTKYTKVHTERNELRDELLKIRDDVEELKRHNEVVDEYKTKIFVLEKESQHKDEQNKHLSEENKAQRKIFENLRQILDDAKQITKLKKKQIDVYIPSPSRHPSIKIGNVQMENELDDENSRELLTEIEHKFKDIKKKGNNLSAVERSLLQNKQKLLTIFDDVNV